MGDYKYLRLEFEEAVAKVTLSRPDRLNIMGRGPWTELYQVQDEIEGNKDIRAVIIKADGPCFSAGVNLKELAEIDGDFVMQHINTLQRTNNRWQEMNPVVIAAVNGVCYGAATEMLCSVDIRIAAEDASFAMQEVQFGLSPDMGGTQRLPRLVGPGQAKRIILACEEIDAKEARDIGFVDIVVPLDKLHARAERLARQIVEKPPWAVFFGKKAINASQDSSIAGGMLLEQIQSVFCCNTYDQKEAVKAFFEKREPEFKGK